jgi:Mn-dependent DtxR family transcriptional regulator
VLLAIAKDPTARLQDVARAVGVTERTTQKVIRDLERAGYIRIFKDGRRNCYEINAGKNFRHPLAREHSISHLLALLNRSDGTRF